MNEDRRVSPNVPSTGNISPSIIVALGIIALQVLIAIVVYPFLPAHIPVHWFGYCRNAIGPEGMPSLNRVASICPMLTGAGVPTSNRFIRPGFPRTPNAFNFTDIAGPYPVTHPQTSVIYVGSGPELGSCLDRYGLCTFMPLI